MPKQVPYLFDGKLKINDRNIRCKVVGKPGSANDNEPYILFIPGGPGFGLDMYKYFIYALIDQTIAEKRPLPHFILYDPLGCGESDAAENETAEYTVDHFTDMDVTLIETLQKELVVEKINLIVSGRSFGHMVAMNVLIHRPEWADPASSIHLQRILSIVGANGVGNIDYARRFLQEHFTQRKNFHQMAQAEEKLFSGSIENYEDYVKNFVIPMAAAYSPEIEKSFAMQSLLKLVGIMPNFTLKILKSLNKMLQTFGLDSEGHLDTDINTLDGCSFKVLNHFFKTNFGEFNGIEIIKANLELYQQTPICFITAFNDHMIDPAVANDTHLLLRDTSLCITFASAHIINQPDVNQLYNKIICDFLTTAKIDMTDLNNSAIQGKQIPSRFIREPVQSHLLPSSALLSTAYSAQKLGFIPIEHVDDVSDEVQDQIKSTAINQAPNTFSIPSQQPVTTDHSPSYKPF